jgi:hypothetical protein
LLLDLIVPVSLAKVSLPSAKTASKSDCVMRDYGEANLKALRASVMTSGLTFGRIFLKAAERARL